MIFLVATTLAILVMSMSVSDAGETLTLPRAQLLKDQTYAIETVKALADTVAPGMHWAEQLFPESGCFASDGSIKGYKTSFNLDLRATAIGHDLDDAAAINAARDWLTEQRYEFVRDTQQGNGLRQLRAVKEDGTDGIGISISAHPGVIGITGTTKCRP